MIGDRIAGLAVLAVGVAYWRAASNLPRPLLQQDVGPEVFPHLIAGALLVLGGLLVLAPLLRRLIGSRLPLRRSDAPLEPAPDWIAIVLVLVGLAAYVAIYERLGFVVATMLFMGFEVVVLEVDRRRWVSALSLVILLPVALYLLFVKVLGVTLPAGLVG